MKRIRYLDALRGVAIFGILPANIAMFGLPLSTYTDPAWPTGGSARELVAFGFVRFFFDYKFITLFSLLFGAGLMIVRLRADATGRSVPGLVVRRLLALWLFGIGHAVLLWFGDIVSYYAPIGLLLVWAGKWEVKTLKIVGLGLLLVPAVFMIIAIPVVFAIQDDPRFAEVFAGTGDATFGGDYQAGSALGDWGSFFKSFEHWGPGLETDVYREGGFARITIIRVLHWFIGLFMFGIYFAWRIGGLFLLGMAFVKSGLLREPEKHLGTFKRAATLGLIVGLPLHIANLALSLAPHVSAGWTVVAELCLYIGSFGFSAAIAGTIAWLVARPKFPGWLVPFEAIGRTAFTNYLLQSLVCTTIFYSYGLGYFATWDRSQLWLVVAGVWAAQLSISPLWIYRYRTGPVEWAWRNLAYVGMKK